MKITNIVSVIFASLSTQLLAATFTSAPKVDTIADLTNRVVSTSSVTTTPYIEVTRFSTLHDPWPTPRVARFDPTSTEAILAGCVEQTSISSGRWIFDDCFSSDELSPTWFGMPDGEIFDFVEHRTTGQQIQYDAHPAIQAAVDFLSQRGGGTIVFPPGMWRVSESIKLKPDVNVRGNAPISAVQFDGGAIPVGLAVSKSFIFGSYGGGTNAYLNANGLGFPVFLSDGPLYYTNKYTSSFVNYAGDTINYYRGGNIIENLGIIPEYGWSWNGTNYPGSGWVINEVANCELKNSAVWHALAPAVYVRGGLGFVMSDCLIHNNWVGGVFVTDTSDTRYHGNRVIQNKGFGIMFHKANSHYLSDNELWNPTYDLIRYDGTTTTVTNDNYVSAQLNVRSNFVADPVNDTITNTVGTVTGMPIMFGGTSLPGGLDTNTIYYMRSSTANTNGSHWTLWQSSGAALGKTPAATRIDITSAGGSNTWWVRSPAETAAAVYARQAEEVYIHDVRLDMLFDRAIVFDDVKRGTIQNVDFFDMGREQKLRGLSIANNDDVIGVHLRNSSGISIVGSTFNAAKDFTLGGISGLFPVDYIGIQLENSPDNIIIGNYFDRLAIAVKIDDTSSVSPPDIRGNNGFSGQELRAVDSTSQITKSDWRGVSLLYSNAIAGVVPAAYTNVTSFAVSAKFQLSTNLPGNGQENIWFLSSSTNFTAPGARQPNSISFQQYFDSAQQRHMLFVRFAGATINDYRDYYTWVNEYRGRHIDTVVQRNPSGTVNLYIDGVLRTLSQNNAGTPPSTTQAVYSPYFGVGRFDVHARSNWLYGLTFASGTNWTYDNIAKGQNWVAPQTNVVALWDFEDAAMNGIWDKSGNGVNGYFANSSTVTFGPRYHTTTILGSGVTRTAPNTYTVASYTSEEIQDLIAAMLVGNFNISIVYDDTIGQITINGPSDEYMQDLIAGMLVAGTNVTIAYNDPANTLTISSVGGTNGVAGSGTNVFVNGLLIQPARFTNNAAVTGGIVWLTNANGHIVGYATNIASGSGTTYTFNNTDGNVVLTLVGTNLTINLNTNIGVAQANIGVVALTNQLTVDVGGTGDTNLTSQAILIGNGTNAIREVGPVAHGIAGWSNNVAAVITAGSNVTITNGVISATGGSGSGETNTASNLGTPSSTVQGLYNSKSGVDLRFRSLEAGSGITISSNANTVSIAATGAGTVTFTTNLLGYIAKSITQVSVSNTVTESALLNFELPANTLNADGDEIEVYVPAKYQMYSSQTTAYRWDFYLDYNETPTAVSGIYTTLPFTSSYYAQSWTARIKRMSSNTVSMLVTHLLGSDDNYDGTNLVEQTRFLQNYTMQNPGGWASNFNFALTVTLGEASTVHGVNTFGYTIHKIGSGGSGSSTNYISAVTSDFQVNSGTLSLSNTAVTAGTYPNATVTVDAKGRVTSISSNAVSSGITWDIDSTYVLTNTDTTIYPVLTNGVPDGVSRTYELLVAQSGLTNGGSWKLFARIANRSGTASATNWIDSGGAMDTNALAYLTNSGTNLLVMARGPLYQPQNGRIRGSYLQVTNAGAYAYVPTLDTNGLLLVWRFDEGATGDRTSSDANALVLTSTNTVGFSTSGVRSNAAHFSRASSQSLGLLTTNLVEVQTNLNFSLTAWVNPSSFPSSGQIYGIATKTDPGVNARVEYALTLRYFGASEFEFNFLTGTNGAGAGTHAVVSSTRGTATNQWYMVACGRDAAAGSNWISVAGSPKEWVASPGPGPTATPFRVGLYGSATHFFNGRIDEVTFWKTNITSAHISFLTNNPPPTLP